MGSPRLGNRLCLDFADIRAHPFFYTLCVFRALYITCDPFTSGRFAFTSVTSHGLSSAVCSHTVQSLYRRPTMVDPQPEGRTQVSVLMEDGLRGRLEREARRAVRSLSGEITFRLLQSLDETEAVAATPTHAGASEGAKQKTSQAD
jgi:hypothetical protein